MFSLHSIQFHLDKARSCKVKVNMLYSSMSFTWRTWCLDFHVLNLGSFHVRSVSWLLASFATAKALFIFISVLFTVVKLASTMITILSCSLLIWLTAASFGPPVKFPFWMSHVFLSAVFIALANSNAFLWSKRHSAAIDVEFFHHLLQSISYHILHLIPKITMLQSDRHHSATYCWIDSLSFMNCETWTLE